MPIFAGRLLAARTFKTPRLYGAKMQGMEAHQANFRGADLRQANLGGAYLEGAIMPPPARQPSPSEIARDKRPREPDQSRDNSEETGRERSRGNGR